MRLVAQISFNTTVAALATLMLVPVTVLHARIAAAQTNPQAIRDCLDTLMYDRNWVPARRTQISAKAAAEACREQPENPVAIKTCIDALMYDRRWSPPRRTEIADQVAAKVCRKQPTNPTAAAATVQDCMDKLMYDRNWSPPKRTTITQEAAAIACQDSY